jgi:hypothetical protein
MPGELRGRELDGQVRNWLGSQNPPVKFVDDFTDRAVSKSDSLSADFMVLTPFPMAIITMTFSGASAMRMKSKRFLAQRISLAERFGNFMPVIVIVPNEADIQVIRFADMVLSVGKLPDFQSLGKAIKLNADVQTILRDGEPPPVSFSSEGDVDSAWNKALSLENLSSEKSTFPRNSLAGRLQEILVPLKESTLAKSLSNENESISGSPLSSIRQPIRGHKDLISSPWWMRSRDWSDEFDRVLFEYIAEKCGGKVESKRHRDPLLQSHILRHVWKSRMGRDCVMRRQMMSGVSEAHKTRELVAEAWMSRAFLKPRVCAQVLLAGTIGLEPGKIKTIAGNRTLETKPDRLGIKYINALEAAGWVVAPWDFAEEEPRFITFLKEVGND